MSEGVGIRERVDRIARIAGVALIVALACIPLVTGRVGWDFEHAYRAETLSREYGGYTYNPWPVYWLLYPFAILPVRWGALLWYLANAGGYLYALRKLGGHPLWFALSLPCIWTFTGGQIEGILAFGLAVALSGPPLLAGLGILLLSLKPQLGLLAILFVLYKRRDWRMLIIPVVVYGLSLAYWGWWIDDWLAALPGSGSNLGANIPNTSLYPYALALIPLLFIFRDLKAWLIVQSLIMPYFAIYSFAPALTQDWPITGPFIIIASWLSLLAYVPGDNPLARVRWMAMVMAGALAVELWMRYRNKAASSPIYPKTADG